MRDPDFAHDASSDADVGARLMLILLCVIWGATWPIMRIALYEIPPLSMRTVTAALGSLTLYLACRIYGRSLRVATTKDWLHLTVGSLLNIVAFTVFGSFAQLSAATSRVTILAYTMPIWSVLFAWLLLREWPNRLQGTALLLCAAGLAILIYPLAETTIPPGIWLALLTGVCWAAGTVYLKWARIKADPMAIASWQVTIAFVVTTAFMLIFEGRLHFAHASPVALLCTASTGFLANGVAYGLWFAIVRRLPAMTASLGVLGSPAIGVVASILLLGERPTATDLVGFTLIFAASACVLFARPQAERANA
ncbi:MAG: DMT family transporter [Xanthobacteraceae bacterium]